MLLEDNEDRIKWFKRHIPDIDVVSTAAECIAWLANNPAYDFFFLDHDLGALDYALFINGQTQANGNGHEVARHMCELGYLGDNVVIHSWNPAGAANMKNILKNATVIPFGKFTIEQY